MPHKSYDKLVIRDFIVKNYGDLSTSFDNIAYNKHLGYWYGISNK